MRFVAILLAAMLLSPVQAAAQLGSGFMPAFAKISGGVGTATAIPRWDSTGNTLTDGLLRDDGTNVTLASGALIVPDGTAAAPSLRMSQANQGWFLTGAGTFFTDGAAARAGYNRSTDTWVIGSTTRFGFGETNADSTADTMMGRQGAANLRQGAADAAAPVSQYFSVQNVSTGTANTAGVARYIDAAQGTGTGASGSIIMRVAPAGGAGSSQNALTALLTLSPETMAMPSGTRVGLATSAGGGITFGAIDTSVTAAVRMHQNAQTWTSGVGAATKIEGQFEPASGSGSWAALHMPIVINGTSSGVAYGLLVASQTNVLTGGTIKLVSFGTTTSDGFTGYTPLVDLPITGGIQLANGSKPACAAGARGTIYYVAGAGGVLDTLEICRKDAADAYAWVSLF